METPNKPPVASMAPFLFKNLGLDGDEANQSTFVLPSLGPRLKKLAKELHHGRGFVVISGLDRNKYSMEDNTLVFLGVGAYIGEIRGMQTDDGSMFAHARDAKKMEVVQVDRPIKDSNRAAAFHNDLCTDIIAMQTGNSAESGGDQLIVSMTRIHNELLKTRPDIVTVLMKPDWPLDLIIPDALYGFENVPRAPGLATLTAVQISALEEVQTLAQRFKHSLPTRKGDLTFINNFAVLHTREAFEDSKQNKRYLVRMWLKNEELAWKIPPPLRLGNEMVFYDEKLQKMWNLMPVARTMFDVYERSAP
ncbi:hypothetical protein IFR05_003875 [Cadophora sp. M221]|nr:hypothetical protein IFR05_003875 [Cadophora sp. M221]